MKQEEEQEQDGEMDPFYKHQNLYYIATLHNNVMYTLHT